MAWFKGRVQLLSVFPLRTVEMEGRIEARYHWKEDGYCAELPQQMFVVGNAPVSC